MTVWCQALPRERWGVSTWGSVLSPSFMATFSLGGGEGENRGLSLHFTDLKTPVICPLLYPCSQLPGFCKQNMWCIQMHSTQPRSSACRLLETCWGSTVAMLLMYRKKSVSDMTPPCGTPSRIFTLLLKWSSSFTLADLSCRKHRTHLYIPPETPLSCIFSKRRSRQTLSKVLLGRRKQRQPLFFSWKASSISWAMRARRIFCASVFPISHLCW